MTAGSVPSLRRARSRWHRWLAVLGLLATALFLAGALVERGREHTEPTRAVPEHIAPARTEETREATGTEQRDGAGEAAAHHDAEGAEERPSDDAERQTRIFGVNLESPATVGLAVAGSVAVIAGVWLLPGSVALLWLAAATMAMFAALDAREALLQPAAGLAALAVVIGLLHLAAAASAGAAAQSAAPR